jgi:ABC-type uncharacterized transport system ATPase component
MTKNIRMGMSSQFLAKTMGSRGSGKAAHMQAVDGLIILKRGFIT